MEALRLFLRKKQYYYFHGAFPPPTARSSLAANYVGTEMLTARNHAPNPGKGYPKASHFPRMLGREVHKQHSVRHFCCQEKRSKGQAIKGRFQNYKKLNNSTLS